MVSLREIELKILVAEEDEAENIYTSIAQLIIDCPNSIFELSVKRAEEPTENEQGKRRDAT